MATSTKLACNALNIPGASEQLYNILSALQADVAALRASIVAITAQLDADAGVSGTTYGSANNPAALKSAA